MSIDTVASYRGVVGARELVILLGLLLVDLALWMVQLGEVAFSSSYEAARRQASAQLLVLVQVGALWLGGWVLLVAGDAADEIASSSPVAAAEAHALRCDISVGLMWLGVLRWVLATVWRPMRLLLLPGPHPIIERTFVVSNIGFQFHRNNEFMFLMLGETVLQIVVATVGRGESEGRQEDYLLAVTNLTAATSFLLAVEMLYCFRSMVAHQIVNYQGTNQLVLTEQHEEKRLLRDFEDQQLATQTAESGALKLFAAVKQTIASSKLQRRHSKAAGHEASAQPLLIVAKLWNALQQIVWELMAISIMLVGVGVKLCIYNPIADADAPSARPLRLLISISLMIVFALQLFYSMVIRRRHLYMQGPLTLIRTQPSHSLVLILQLMMLAAQALFGLVPLVPAAFIAGQCAISLVQCILLHLHEHKLKVTGSAIHPLAGLPDCLEALRLKASRRRLADQFQDCVPAIVKIQSLQRRKLLRASTKMVKASKAMDS